ncbi:MAG: hypothetical protein B7Y41_09765 [Hydrogenophilales bacterium 28-61-23]|nr:MAG: hypothetical protein B7Y41_09765 [Hydrogenophilales bacterium 28-61-23]
MQRKLIATFVSALFSVAVTQVHAQSTPYYNPANAASSSGVTSGAELVNTIGCPGKGILDAGCVNGVVAQPAPAAKPVTPAPAKVAPAAASAAKAEPVVVASKPADTVLYLPTGVRATSALMIERMAPKEVVAGQPFSYDIKATNLTSNKLSDVEVQDICSNNFKLLGSTPDAERLGNNQLRWKLGELNANESRLINVNGEIADATGAQSCLSANYDQAACMAFNVVKPELNLKTSAPAEVMRCDAIPLTYTVANTGTGVARNAAVTQVLPEGVSLKSGLDKMAAGDLGAGASKEYQASVMAAKPGVYSFNPSAVAEPGMQANAVATTRVTEPALQVVKNATNAVLLGRNLAYDITVTNTGDAVARNLKLEETLPVASKVNSASDNGRVEAGGIVWNLADLAPKQSHTVKVDLQPGSVGNIDTSARATAYCAADASAQGKTAIIGIPAVLLEVVDLTDPVEVGKSTVYVITATNQGTATDINVRIVAELEKAMEFVSGDGATAMVNGGNRIEFAPLPKLEPGAKAEWRVTAKALSQSDHRFTVIMTSDVRQRPVMETEATTLYK